MIEPTYVVKRDWSLNEIGKIVFATTAQDKVEIENILPT